MYGASPRSRAIASDSSKAARATTHPRCGTPRRRGGTAASATSSGSPSVTAKRRRPPRRSRARARGRPGAERPRQGPLRPPRERVVVRARAPCRAPRRRVAAAASRSSCISAMKPRSRQGEYDLPPAGLVARNRASASSSSGIARRPSRSARRPGGPRSRAHRRGCLQATSVRELESPMASSRRASPTCA